MGSGGRYIASLIFCYSKDEVYASPHVSSYPT